MKPFNPKIIALAGNARVGKDTFAQHIMDEFIANGYRCERRAFADPIKQELDSFLIDKYGISAWTEDPAEKRIIRPELIRHGEEAKQFDPNKWIRLTLTGLEDSTIYVVTDVRFLAEVDEVKKHNGYLAYLFRFNKGQVIEPGSHDEAKLNPIIKQKADARLNIPTIEDYKEFHQYYINNYHQQFLNYVKH